MHPRRDTSSRLSGKGKYSDPNRSFNREEGNLEDHAALVSRIASLEGDLERRQKSYVERERAYRLRIDELEDELASQRKEKTGWMAEDPNLSHLKSMQALIIKHVEQVQDRTAKILQEQERDLIRSFRARLFDVQTELEKEKSKKDDGAQAWIEKSRQLEVEVEWCKEVSDRLERLNQTLSSENQRLRSHVQRVEDERDSLEVKVEHLERECKRESTEHKNLRIAFDSQKIQLENMQQQAKEPLGSAIMGGPSTSLSRNHELEELNKELKKTHRVLADERKALKTVRQNYATELNARTEMELLLRQAVEDVRKEISRRNIENGQFPRSAQSATVGDMSRLFSRTPGSIAIDEFAQEDRERVLELLLSQERVVSLLYSRTFPVNGTASSAVAAPPPAVMGATNVVPGIGISSSAANTRASGKVENEECSPREADDSESRPQTSTSHGDRSVDRGSGGATNRKLPPIPASNRPQTGGAKK